MNIFRVPFLMERLVPGSITGTLDSTYLAALKSVRDRSIDGYEIPQTYADLRGLTHFRPSTTSPRAVPMPSLIPTTMADSTRFHPFLYPLRALVLTS
jgi:hypothetical protein